MEPGLAQGLVDWDASWFQAPPPEATWLELHRPGGCPSSDRRRLGAAGRAGASCAHSAQKHCLSPGPRTTQALCVSQAIVLGTKLQLQADLDAEKVRVFLT